MLEISGKIIAVLPERGGISKAGKDWKSQEYVIETNGQYPRNIVFTVLNDNIETFGLRVGMEATIYADVNAKEWNGKWYNSITCWKATTSDSDNAQKTAHEQQKPSEHTNPAPSANPSKKPTQSTGMDDVLPF